MIENNGGRLHRIAVIGSHSPRQCGIATFSSDLADALESALPRTNVVVCAVNDPGCRYEYPSRVTQEITEGELDDYRRAGDTLNALGVDVVSLQHEFGIYGGPAGSHVLALMRQLHMPVVVTTHTVLTEPSLAQRAVMDELTERAARVVVMSQQGVAILRGIYGVPASKIQFIPHGIPSAPLPSNAKHQLGVSGRSMLMTYGLLSPDKGIETVIGALPAIAERHPDVVYVVVGATHPAIRKREGERYRDSLLALGRERKVDSHLVFRDRFVSPTELAVHLGAADLYVTPYLQLEQITSGTLAYAVGAGKAVVSTPYRYARELLAGDRGVLVPRSDPGAMAREINALLSDGARRASMGARGRALGLTMHWPVVAGLYAEALGRAAHDSHQEREPAGAGRREPTSSLPPMLLGHLDALTDSVGILQHASYDVPRYEDGYCLDDNARALLLANTIAAEPEPALAERGRGSSRRYLAFVTHAFDRETGRFRNFMSYAREFHPAPGSEDCHGRALWALGHVVGRPQSSGHARHARDLFRAALPAVLGFTSPRAWAYTLLGLASYLECLDLDAPANDTRMVLADKLSALYDATSTRSWPWFEKELTYANARLCEALIVSGEGLERPGMTAAGLQSLDWLAVQQRTDDTFSPVGAPGWRREAPVERPEFDQQPLEAAGMVSACLAAFRLTREPKWMNRAERALAWFVGHNDLQQSLVDSRTGACRDGLHADRPNENQGAESSLSYSMALLELRQAQRHTTNASKVRA
ncbi:MAG: glycosyltransferase family 4 protein [Deltaproteobacteria bacterium]|nr:glycosyltransferase family 4 protein [Deltaproteobacteria bacterium]